VISRPALPVDALLPEILASLQRCPNLVIEAAPGAGKTTRIPPELLKVVAGEVLVLEPRRIAARMAARRVASELGQQPGETVGYQVRFEEVAGPRTRLRFMTEGVLTRRLISDPLLSKVDAVVLDEFHEGHIDSDFALALLKRLQRKRPDLRILVMSATLEAGALSGYLGDCPVVHSEGRLFPLSIEYLPYSPSSLEHQVRNAVELLLAEGCSGDILIFLPGAAEIRRAMRECESLARRAGLLALPLYGSLPPQEQDRAVTPAAGQKLIFATNVAESSITVEGVAAVIDSGLARSVTWSRWTGMPHLRVSRISKASAKQRAGRAGRMGPGRVLRLYTAEDYGHRPEQEVPEILRSDLSQLCLALRAMEIDAHAGLDWLDAPPSAAMEGADALLDRLGATGEMAARLSRYPLPPRLARLLDEAVRREAGYDGCVAAALLASDVGPGSNDLLTAMGQPSGPQQKQHIEQLRKIARAGPHRSRNVDALLRSVLAGFPDRVARLRAGKQVMLSSGGSAEVMGEAPAYEFMIALDAEDRSDKPLPLVPMTARIEPEWLIDLFPDHVREESSVHWNQNAERVEGVSRLLYDELIVQEWRGAVPDGRAASELLAQKALEAGLQSFVNPDALHELIARIEFAGRKAPDIAQALRDLCVGLQSFSELRNAAKSLLSNLQEQAGARLLNELAPASLRLNGGRETRVHYEKGKPPWIASRLQDFFGMRETPRIGPERKPVVIHLLAPNHRAVQTTTDLAGFWERLYPQVRRELMRRYPKHAWPERP
jgi:ATP-dependent helicase HrpB